jgi:hypothetical protein
VNKRPITDRALLADKRPPKPPPKNKRLPPGGRLPTSDILPTPPQPRPCWKEPVVTEVTHLNAHGVLALLLADLLVHPPANETALQYIAAAVDFYASVDGWWMVNEVPPLSKEDEALFPFTDITKHEFCYCNDLWKLQACGRGRKAVKDVVRRTDWLRWLAVRDAHVLPSADGRPMSWEDAFAGASKRLASTFVKGSAPTMKRSYDKIQRVLKAVVTESN